MGELLLALVLVLGAGMSSAFIGLLLLECVLRVWEHWHRSGGGRTL